MFDNSAVFDVDLDDLQSRIAPSPFPRIVSQRTLKSSIGCTGIGLHSGKKMLMTLHPADPNSGVRFRRTDLAGSIIPARWDTVSDTRLNTCVSNEQGHDVRTIEHLMSALSAMRIDNVLIDLNGPEVPVMDGSASPFVFLIECAGVTGQTAAAPRHPYSRRSQCVRG